MGVSLRKTARLGRALLAGRTHPFSLTFILTDRCNFRCHYCNIPHEPTAEMSADQFCAAIDELAAAGMARASFSGGEALLRADAPRILAHARQRGLFTSLNTNGWLVADRWSELAPSLDMLVVSLDGDRATHDAICRCPGSFDRVLDTLDRARAAGIATATIMVLDDRNRDQVKDVLRVCAEYGAWAYVQPAHGDCYDHSKGTSLGAASLAELAEDLERARREGLPVASSAGFVRRLRAAPRFSDCSTCAAGRYFGSVLPDGRVVPCHLHAEGGAYLNGRDVGFARAFRDMPHPSSGGGCAITPYVESDLILSGDPRAIAAGLRRMKPARPR